MTTPPNDNDESTEKNPSFAKKAGTTLTQTIEAGQAIYGSISTVADRHARRSSREIIVIIFFGLTSIASLLIFIYAVPEPKPGPGDFLVNFMTEVLGVLIFYLIFYIGLREIATLDVVEMDRIEKRLNSIEQKLDYIIQLHDSDQNDI